MRTTRHSIGRLTALSLLAAIGDRAFALLLIALIAAFFGAGAESDTYFLALVIPSALGAGLTEALYAAALPRFIDDVARGTSSFRLLWRMTALVGAAATATYALVILVVSPGNGVVWLLFAPMIFTLTLSSVYAASLVAHRRYGIAVARVPLSSAIALVVVAGGILFSKSIELFAFGVVVGYATSLVLLVIASRKHDHHRREPESHVTMRSVTAAAASAFAATLVGGPLVVVAERILASGLAVGSVTLLTFARNLALLPLLVSQALANGIFPTASLRHTQTDREGVRRLAVRAIKLSLIFALATCILVVVCRREIVRIALERGALDSAEAAETAHLLHILVWAVLGLTVAAATARCLFAVGRYRIVAVVSGFALIVYVGLAVPLREVYQRDGLAFAFLASASVAGAISAAALIRALDIPVRQIWLDWTVYPVMFGGVFGAASYGASQLAHGPSSSSLVSAASTVAGSTAAGLVAMGALVAISRARARWTDGDLESGVPPV